MGLDTSQPACDITSEESPHIKRSNNTKSLDFLSVAGREAEDLGALRLWEII